MMEFAYGTMGLSPEEFAGLTPFEFDLKCKGFVRLKEDEENNFRRLAYIVFAMQADPKAVKKTTIDDIWPTAKTSKRTAAKKQDAKKRVSSMLELYKKQRGLT